MADPRGFLKHDRELPSHRPVPVRLRDWKEVYEDFPEDKIRTQASRCMDCGIPFCNNGCPLGNIIPDWNDLTYRGLWHDAIDRLHATNNFPEFTGRLCPAPCESACVLGIHEPPVAIKRIEVEIIDRAFAEGWVVPMPAATKTGKKVAVVGSGPAGLAAAQQLTRAGHDVVVYERADRIGGLLRYGIPEFKMEKRHLDRRLEQMEAEGTVFRTNVNVGVDVTADELRAEHDAVVLCCGATQARDLPIEGRELSGIHQAMEFLPWANKVQEGDLDESPISAEGKDVIIIGGGDTGADCLGTSHRHGARSIHQFEIMPRPPEERPEANPWPTYPMVYKVTSAHEEGGEREYAINTVRFVGDEDGNLTGLDTVRVEQVVTDGHMRFQPVEGSEQHFPAQMVFLAMGFTGPEQNALVEQFGIDLTDRGNVARDDGWATNVDGVFVAGDMGRGQSLIVWAIAEGRSAAAAVDTYHGRGQGGLGPAAAPWCQLSSGAIALRTYSTAKSRIVSTPNTWNSENCLGHTKSGGCRSRTCSIMINRLVMAKRPAARAAGSRAPSRRVTPSAATPASASAATGQLGRLTSANRPVPTAATTADRRDLRVPRRGGSMNVGMAAVMRPTGNGAGRAARTRITSTAIADKTRARSTSFCGAQTSSTVPPDAGTTQPLAKPSTSVGGPRETPSRVAAQPRLWLCPSTSQRPASPVGMSTVSRTSLSQSGNNAGIVGGSETGLSLRSTS